MSGVVKGIKKVVKGVGKFVKKYWKPILAVAAVAFTAGLATVGTAGFSAAAGGGGFAGTLGAIGKTMVAGVQAIGGSLGIGKGASLASFGGTGTATLGTGAAAQALGFAAPGAAQTAGAVASGAGAGAGAAGAGASYLPSSVVANAGGGAAGGTGAGGLGAFGPGGAAWSGTGAGGIAPALGTASTAAGSSFLNSPIAGVLMQGIMGGLQGYMQGQALEDQEPRGFWGVDPQGGPSLSPGDFAGGGAPMWSSGSWGGNPNSQRQPPLTTAGARVAARAQTPRSRAGDDDMNQGFGG